MGYNLIIIQKAKKKGQTIDVRFLALDLTNTVLFIREYNEAYIEYIRDILEKSKSITKSEVKKLERTLGDFTEIEEKPLLQKALDELTSSFSQEIADINTILFYALCRKAHGERIGIFNPVQKYTVYLRIDANTLIDIFKKVLKEEGTYLVYIEYDLDKNKLEKLEIEKLK